MDDLRREKEKGLSRWYLKDVLFKRRRIGGTYHTPGFGFAAQLFAVMSKFIIARLGHEEPRKRRGQEGILDQAEEGSQGTDRQETGGDR